MCPVTQVEQTKQMVKMVPILVATFIPSSLLAQTHTLFIKQGVTLNRSMGPHFDIPPASLSVFVTIFLLISIVLYDRFFIPTVRKYTKNPRGITLLQRMAIGLALHVVIMVVASLVERRRLSVAKDHGIFENDQTVPLSIFVLLPQFALMGIGDSFLEVARLEFFYDQAPEGMKSLGTAYWTTGIGVGYFLSSFILSTVADVTKKNGRKGWILDNLNESRLDYYYAFYALLSFVNLLFFILVAKYFVYNNEVNETLNESQEDIGKWTEQGYIAS
ncbi:putative proton-dependent oligopeptide transporter family, MFS transporter superfamily [Helianthus annuus]|nr:putative proton-dependent oligopeptide transporter family, MFS transporter superfamily [Helianthus annuus]